MKRILSMLLILALAIGALSACDGMLPNDNEPPDNGTTPEDTTPEDTTPGGTTPEGTTPDGTTPEEDPLASKGLAFKLSEDGLSYTVTGIGTCTDTDVRIPSKYQGLPVTSIGVGAFSECYSLASIDLPTSVTSIGDDAFRNCSSLESITIPFGVTSIGARVFSGCSSLESIEIPSSVTSIGDYAFRNCSSLESITIPSSVTSIGAGVFSYCSSLANISVAAENANYASIDGNLYSKDGKTLIQYACGKTAISFAIPSSVTSIGERAFYDCESLESIAIPMGVTSIGDWAFYGCDSLTSIEILSSVTSIGERAFSGCSSLTSIHFDGNKTAWENIPKGGGWDSNTGAYTVYCADGNIEKQF